MTLAETAERFRIDKEKLLYYEKNGLFECHRQQDGSIDYCDETLEYISLIELLLKAGLDIDTVRTYLNGLGNDKASNEEQIKILIRQRYALLDDIHDKEKTLHRLDYLIHEKKENTKITKEK